jgi:hypothetical protein
MIVGNPSVFAIESEITAAYARLGARALGYFVIHLKGVRFGVQKPDASLLACSFDEVANRLARRGKHTAPFAEYEDGRDLADSYLIAIYSPDPCGLRKEDFEDVIYENDLTWAPDGDEAFDDGSYVLQFDVDDRVRLIGFKTQNGHRSHPTDFADLWIWADEYYGILEEWLRRFEEAWQAMPKSSEFQ